MKKNILIGLFSFFALSSLYSMNSTMKNADAVALYRTDGNGNNTPIETVPGDTTMVRWGTHKDDLMPINQWKGKELIRLVMRTEPRPKEMKDTNPKYWTVQYWDHNVVIQLQETLDTLTTGYIAKKCTVQDVAHAVLLKETVLNE